MIFNGDIDGLPSWQLVLCGDKTETWRPEKEGDEFCYDDGDCTITVFRLDKNGNRRMLYQTGKRYSVQPGRGQKGVGTIEIEDITCRSAGRVSEKALAREGFSIYRRDAGTRRERFLAVLKKFYGKNAATMQGYSVRFRLVGIE